MSAKTVIQWTDRTWNPVRGCSIVSAGCTNCYAMRQAHRFSGAGQPYEGLTRLAERGPIWTGKIRLVPEALDEPLRWKKPQRIFVNSMSDLFHEDVPFEFVKKVWDVATEARRHTFQILTKRPERMRAFSQWMAGADDVSIAEWPRNVHLGVSVENQETADERIPLLLQTPAALRFLSVEPLLESVYLEYEWLGKTLSHLDTVVDWVIVGGESGPHARPCSIEWIRSIVRQCKAANVACFVKQLGAKPTSEAVANRRDLPWIQLRDSHGGDPSEWPEDLGGVREFPR